MALQDGIEPDLISERIGELREQKAALEDALAELGAEQGEAEDEESERRLAAVPDLSGSLRSASTQIKRQVFEAFDLQIHFDKREGRVEISATVSEEVAKALDGSEDLFEEGSAVTLTNTAGARLLSEGDARIPERIDSRHGAGRPASEPGASESRSKAAAVESYDLRSATGLYRVPDTGLTTSSLPPRASCARRYQGPLAEDREPTAAREGQQPGPPHRVHGARPQPYPPDPV